MQTRPQLALFLAKLLLRHWPYETQTLLYRCYTCIFLHACCSCKCSFGMSRAFAVQAQIFANNEGQPKAPKEKAAKNAKVQNDSQAAAPQAEGPAPSKSDAKVGEKAGLSQGPDGQQQAARDSSKTVFVRSLPPDVSQDQLQIAFRQFGKLRACRWVHLCMYHLNALYIVLLHVCKQNSSWQCLLSHTKGCHMMTARLTPLAGYSGQRICANNSS